MRNLKKKKKSSFIPNNLLNLRDIHGKIWSSKSKEEHPDSISEPQAEFFHFKLNQIRRQFHLMTADDCILSLDNLILSQYSC